MDEYGSAAMLMAVFESGFLLFVTGVLAIGVDLAKALELIGVAFLCASAACTFDFNETFLSKKPEPEIGFASTAFTDFGNRFFRYGRLGLCKTLC